MKYLSFSLIVALGLGSAAFASAEKMLPLKIHTLLRSLS